MASRGLGRGLGSLIPSAASVPPVQVQSSAGDPRTVKTSQIMPNRYQPRRNFNEEKLKELSETIHQGGMIQPLIVTRMDSQDGQEEKFELIAGERRWRAAKLAGLEQVPIVIRKVSEREHVLFSLIENVQREDLNPIEEAHAFKKVMEEFHLTQEELAKAVGKGRVVIANTLRLLNLPQFLQDAVSDGTISAGHARNLLSIDDGNLQREVAEKILRERLSVREVEKIVSDWKGALASGKVSLRRKKEPEIRDLEDTLQRTLGTKVEIRSKGKGKNIKGSVVISFYTLEDLERLTGILKKG